MIDIQKFRANSYVRTILRPRLADVREVRYSVEGWGKLLPRLRIIARGAYDLFPLEGAEGDPAEKFLFLLNDVELFEYGAAAGIFDQSSVDSFYAETWSVLDVSFGEQAPKYRKLLGAIFQDVRNNVAPFSLENRGGGQFFYHYSRNQKLHLPEVKQFIQVFLFSSEAEWRSYLSILMGLANAMVSNPLIRLSSNEIEAVCWAFSGAERMLEYDGDRYEAESTSGPYPNLIERIANSRYGWVATRRSALDQARQIILDASVFLTEDETTAAVHALRFSPEQGRVSRDALRKMIESQPPTETL